MRICVGKPLADLPLIEIARLACPSFLILAGKLKLSLVDARTQALWVPNSNGLFEPGTGVTMIIGTMAAMIFAA